MKRLNRRIDRYGRNEKGGRDLIVGDIHGHFARLRSALDVIRFDIHRDRLFSVGDLVDRGPQSEQATSWLTFPWFHAVRGNHEEAAIAWADAKIDRHHYQRGFGAGWNITSPLSFAQQRAAMFETLPIAIELETERGMVAIVHACCPVPSWTEFRALMAEVQGDGVMTRADAAANMALWAHAKDRGALSMDGAIKDVRAVVVGHTEKERLTTWDNVYFIDTGGWSEGHFTILDAATLSPADRPREQTLDWSGT